MTIVGSLPNDRAFSNLAESVGPSAARISFSDVPGLIVHAARTGPAASESDTRRGTLGVGRESTMAAAKFVACSPRTFLSCRDSFSEVMLIM